MSYTPGTLQLIGLLMGILAVGLTLNIIAREVFRLIRAVL